MKHASAAHLSETSSATCEKPILVFDSGIGGLTVLREARVLMPDRRFVYIADDAGFPYGGWEEEALRARIVELLASLLRSTIPKSPLSPVTRLQHWCWMICGALIRPCLSLAPCLRSNRPLNVQHRGLFQFWQRRARSSAPILAILSNHLPRNVMCGWSELTGLPQSPKHIFAVKRSMRRWSSSRLRRASSKKTANARISLCWPAPTIHFWQMCFAD